MNTTAKGLEQLAQDPEATKEQLRRTLHMAAERLETVILRGIATRRALERALEADGEVLLDRTTTEEKAEALVVQEMNRLERAGE